jgi:hypothetical protein
MEFEEDVAMTNYFIKVLFEYVQSMHIDTAKALFVCIGTNEVEYREDSERIAELLLGKVHELALTGNL